jgi:hypothetical protein
MFTGRLTRIAIAFGNGFSLPHFLSEQPTIYLLYVTNVSQHRLIDTETVRQSQASAFSSVHNQDREEVLGVYRFPKLENGLLRSSRLSAVRLTYVALIISPS